MLGAAAGILFGVSDVSIKALTGTVPGDPLTIISPWTLVAVTASIAAFYASARGLQIGEGLSVIALTSVAANVCAILGGIIVFGDPIGSDALEIVARASAFALVIAAAGADARADARRSARRLSSGSAVCRSAVCRETAAATLPHRMPSISQLVRKGRSARARRSRLPVSSRARAASGGSPRHSAAASARGSTRPRRRSRTRRCARSRVCGSPTGWR